MDQQDRSIKRTVNRIDSLRERFNDSRRGSRRSVSMNNSFEYDIIGKALELLRQTITIGNRSTQ